MLRQFLLEAVLLSVLGGAVGVATGMFGVQAIAKNLHWPTHVSTNAIWVAFGVAAAIGITFGYYPAVRAARLDPIEALRVE